MMVDVVLYKDQSVIATYRADGNNWRDCADAISSWLRIEVVPYWEPGVLEMAARSGTDQFAAAAIYGIARAWGMIDTLPHDWLPPFSVVVEDASS